MFVGWFGGDGGLLVAGRREQGARLGVEALFFELLEFDNCKEIKERKEKIRGKRKGGGKIQNKNIALAKIISNALF